MSNRAARRHKSHVSDIYLQGSPLDRLLAGLPDEALSRKIAAKAMPVAQAKPVGLVATRPPLHAVLYSTTCHNCGTHGEAFGFLARKVTTLVEGIPTTKFETVSHADAGEFPASVEVQSIVVPFCPTCLDEEMRHD